MIIPKGEEGGPRFHTLARMAINPLAYKQVGRKAMSISPFSLKPPGVKFNMKQITSSKKMISDFLSTVFIDHHLKLKKAWQKVIKTKNKHVEQKLIKPAFSKEDFWGYAKNWEDEKFRQEKINQWTRQFKKRYESLIDNTKS